MENIHPEIIDIMRREFPSDRHPYRVLERIIEENASPEKVALEIGCGRTAPTLKLFHHKFGKLIGVDLVEFSTDNDYENIKLFKGSAENMDFIGDGEIDFTYSRSVMEHIIDAELVYKEIYRILKLDGTYTFLTPNFWDYGSLIAHLIPNKFHAEIVKKQKDAQTLTLFPLIINPTQNTQYINWREKTG